MDDIRFERGVTITLAALDVKDLYPSISTKSGNRMGTANGHRHTTHSFKRDNPYKNMLRDFLKLIVEDNTFSFNDKFYKQIRGVAMETIPCAPTLANLFMDYSTSAL